MLAHVRSNSSQQEPFTSTSPDFVSTSIKDVLFMPCALSAICGIIVTSALSSLSSTRVVRVTIFHLHKNVYRTSPCNRFWCSGSAISLRYFIAILFSPFVIFRSDLSEALNPLEDSGCSSSFWCCFIFHIVIYWIWISVLSFCRFRLSFSFHRSLIFFLQSSLISFPSFSKNDLLRFSVRYP